ncbi:hypothetical protein AMS59_02895 [Lysinibacillus sp. FJAT-14745]|uniref:hypothetical protein n=1 Tax=Lysinibacillus sp. FJAT-14745 TaxID=1704289 RepID=UPI0006ABAD82|nr:hypothetical protein [Lysinibacillus sp. FJAT-14745]KOP80356.1 hypothetical protein AMS59_02895 [Lysinibacillus sp. FJAT-14745]
MKKWLITLFVAIILLFSGCTLLINSLLPNEYEVLESNWNIYLPKADEIKNLLTTEANFLGDGEWFALFDYSKPIDFSNTGFIKVTSNEISVANNRIAQFKKRTIDIRQNAKEIVDIFNQYDVEAEVGDYYYYGEHNNGNDFIILLYKVELHQLYKYEWHQ